MSKEEYLPTPLLCSITVHISYSSICNNRQLLFEPVLFTFEKKITPNKYILAADEHHENS